MSGNRVVPAEFEDDVRRLRDDEGLSWGEISDRLGQKKEAVRSAYRRKGRREGFMVRGIMPGAGVMTPDELWDGVIGRQEKLEKRERVIRRSQCVRIREPGLPFALAMLSDLHIGDAGTDYVSLRRDAEIIRDTPGLFAEYHGDGINNWITGKLAHLERDEVLPFDDEMQLFCDWLGMLKGKLVLVVSGNHENWTRWLSGIDLVKNVLGQAKCLYDRNEVLFDLRHGANSWTVKVRHAWKYSSVFNDTHGIEVGWERGGVKFDIGIGGHVHRATVCRPFYRQGQKLYAVLVGTYKVEDPFGRQIGVARPNGRGCGAMLFYPDGRSAFFEDLETCADFLTWLRRQ